MTDFSVDHDDIAIDDILDIHKHLMKNIKCSDLLKNDFYCNEVFWLYLV